MNTTRTATSLRRLFWAPALQPIWLLGLAVGTVGLSGAFHLPTGVTVAIIAIALTLVARAIWLHLRPR
jgi:hypothetical protein